MPSEAVGTAAAGVPMPDGRFRLVPALASATQGVVKQASDHGAADPESQSDHQVAGQPPPSLQPEVTPAQQKDNRAERPAEAIHAPSLRHPESGRRSLADACQDGDMGEVKYVSRVRVERVKGPYRRAWLPAESEPVVFSVHDQVAEHYQVQPGQVEPRATTLDYVVSAAAG